LQLANHKSALKRSRQSIQRRDRNKAVKTRVRTTVKEVRVAVGEKMADKSREMLIAAQSVIDKAAKKGVIKKRAASRKISRLSKLINRMTV
jgi:small subunit ribosomal protein S20